MHGKPKQFAILAYLCNSTSSYFAKEDINMELVFFKDIKDPRIDRTKKYPLDELIFSALVAIWSGARSWYEIAEFAEDKLQLLKEFLPFTNGIPSHDTYNRFFSILPEEEFEKAFISFAEYLIGDSLEGKLINLDGKQMRGATKASDGIIHIVAAWCADCKLSLGQVSVDDKSNEITAIPLLLNKLNIKKAEVSIDALGTQTEIAKLINDKQGFYLLAVKDNQKSLNDEVKELCCNYKPIDVDNEIDSYSGKVIQRKCEVFKANPKVITTSSRWAGLKQVIKVTCTTTNKASGETVEDIRYYIVNSKFDAAHYLASTKNHWSIENDCHWQLDISFNEDETRKTKNSAKNFSRLLRFALNCVRSVDFGEKRNKSCVKSRCFALSNSKDLLMKLLYNKAIEK